MEHEDIRCPHCKVIILRKERIVRGADRQGAPEFCPKCGERTEAATQESSKNVPSSTQRREPRPP